MNGERYAKLERGSAGIHTLGSLGAERLRVVNVTPIEEVVGEEVCAHAQGLEAAELPRVRHLRMLQGVTVVPAGRRSQRPLDRLDRDLGCFVPIGMDVDLKTGAVIGKQQSVDLVRPDIPDTIWRPIIVARPTHARRQPLDRAIGNDLDELETQSLVVLLRKRS